METTGVLEEDCSVQYTIDVFTKKKKHHRCIIMYTIPKDCPIKGNHPQLRGYNCCKQIELVIQEGMTSASYIGTQIHSNVCVFSYFMIKFDIMCIIACVRRHSQLKENQSKSSLHLFPPFHRKNESTIKSKYTQRSTSYRKIN